jgi:hypothetical protein
MLGNARRLQRGAGWIIGILTLGALLPSMVAHLPRFKKVPRGHALAAGDRFPEEVAVDLNGQPVKWPSQMFFVLCAAPDSTLAIRMAKFIQLWEESNRLTLPVIAIMRGTKKDVIAFVREVRPSFPVLLDSGDWAERIGAVKPFHLYLVDANARIRFGADYAEPDDLRQLTEKILRGRVTYYDLDRSRALRVGERMPDVSTVNVRTDGDELFQVSGPVICYTSRCPDCSLDGYVTAYAAYESRISPRPAPTLLFSSRFSRAQLKRMGAILHVKARMLQAVENIPGVEDAFSLETYFPSDIVVIESTRNGEIKKIHTWEQFIAPIMEARR